MELKPFFTTGDVNLYTANCITFASSLPDNGLALTVTSPPYDSLRSYTGEAVWDFAQFSLLAEQLYRITKPGGVVVWNVNDQTKDGSESGSSFRQALHFIDRGFKLADTMIYKKANPGGARGSNKTYLQSFEYMFVLSKGNLGTHNLIADRPNKRSGVQKGGGRRNKNGSLSDTVTYESTEYGRRFNIWEYPTQMDEFSAKHPAPFPLALARDHILSWSNEGDLVFDPFSGSGTTALAALQTNRKCIGVDVSQDYGNIARLRLQSSNEIDTGRDARWVLID